MDNLLGLIGNTPMIKILFRYKDKENFVFTKLEFYNLTGSIKDRMAYYILKDAKEQGLLKDNQPIIEATSGNTGISLAAIGALYKHPVHIFMPDWVSKERRDLMRLYGAKIYLVSREEGGFQKAISLADQLAKDIGGFRTNQFANVANIRAHYETTGLEIINQVDNIGGFVSGVGTGGTLIGVGKRLKEKDKRIKLYAIEPDSLPILSKGITTGTHKIEGIGDDFIPDIIDQNLIDEIILVNDMDSINMSRLLAKKLGLGVGNSSGANFLASVLAKENNELNIVTVFPDDNKKYLSTDLIKDIDSNELFLSNQIELIGYEIVNKLL